MWAHISNILIHILCGTLAIGIGLFLLAADKGSQRHIRWGRTFAVLGLIVCLTAATGNIFFRFMPLFAVLTLLVLYLIASGWRVIYTKAKGPAPLDLAICATGYLAGAALIYLLAQSSFTKSPVVIYSTMGALVTVLIYDSARWFFPPHWHSTLWRYEHVYKIISSLFAMISALFGNTLRVGQPWSQLVPSVAGILVVLYFFAKLYRKNHQGNTASRQEKITLTTDSVTSE